MKRYFCIFLCAFLLIPGLALLAHAEDTGAQAFVPKPAKLTVSGKEIETDQAVMYYDDAGEMVYFDLPLIATLQALGAKVFWVNERKALIFYGGFLLQLDTQRGVIYLLSPQQDYFSLTGGGPAFPSTRTQIGQEYVIDERAAQSLFVFLEIGYSCDAENAAISVAPKGTHPALSYLLTIMAVLILMPFAVFKNMAVSNG